MTIRCRGFTFPELLVGIIFIAMAILAMLILNSLSRRGAMDAVFEIVALQLAEEPLEVFHASGYEFLTNYATHQLEDYPLGSHDLDSPETTWFRRPPEARFFQRDIEMTQIPPIAGKSPGVIRIRVRVYPKADSGPAAWLTRKEIVLDSLVVEEPR